MDVVSSVLIDCPPRDVHAVVDDLSTYPRWLDIVKSADSVGGPDDLAWNVLLQARLGPLARSKRLRMVRRTCTANEVVFERDELDGRSHGSWRLSVTLTPFLDDVGPTEVTMRLHYSGSMFGAVMEPVLKVEIDKAKGRLVALVSGQ